MHPSDPSIFICYRRRDSNSAAYCIYERLVEEFGETAVFLDHFGFHGGDEWRAKTRPILERARAVVAVVNEAWVTLGRDRFKDPDDPVRQELSFVVDRDDVALLPVAIDDTSYPPARSAEEALAGVSDVDLVRLLQRMFAKTALKVRFDRNFKYDIDSLVQRLDDVPGVDRASRSAASNVGGLNAIRV